MARLPQGILGGVVGKVGGVIGTSWKGIPIIKQRPLSVANPRTAKQVAQRTKMTNIVEFARPILASVIKPLNDRFAQRQSGYNLFVSRNIKLFESELPDPAGDLEISRGKLGDTNIISISATSGDTELGIAIDPVLDNPFKQNSDLAYIVCVNATNGEIKGGQSSEVRSDGSLSFYMSEDFSTSDILHVYVSFLRADGTMVSNTSYKSITV